MTGELGTVYLFCFAPGIPRDERANSCHYLGWTSRTPEERLADHLAGAGSPLVLAAHRRGLDVRIARTWQHADRNFERALKNQHNLRLQCPDCNPTRSNHAHA